MSVRVLDLDGPILDGKMRHYACFSDIVRQSGMQPPPVDSYWGLKREGVGARVLLQQLVPHMDYTAFAALWRQNIEKPEYLALDRVQPGAPEKLVLWRSQGVACILVTMRHNHEVLVGQLQGLGLFPLFDEIVSCDSKDKAAAFMQACPVHAKSKGIWVGDTEVDASAATAVGMPCYLVSCGVRSESFLKNLHGPAVVPELHWVP